MIGYQGDVLEDLKEIHAVLSYEGMSHLASAANHALQILDSNRNIIVAYEAKNS